ncbi:hypothetical protein IFM89_027886 [Coptis chinensis]|uniref:non-specific serine/threonine protein kinase n=1 Tax=Coptis chinensis TaxID=261450 RepID=A0A835HKB9_9MAGN|nr:hypothetical protein IFM89_027886 [Coptis chinensis]
MQFEEGNIVEWAVPQIKAGDIAAILDSALKPPEHLEALTRIANVACRYVRMRGKERPFMDKVTTALELHKSSRRSSNRSGSEATRTPEVIEADNYQRLEFRAPSWITFPSAASSKKRKSSASEDVDVDGKNSDTTSTMSNAGGGGDGLMSDIILALGPIKMETQKTEVLLYIQPVDC